MIEEDRPHQHLQELLGAHALDALDAEEAAAVEAHVAHCPACRSELDIHRAMAAALATSSRDAGTAMPPALWDRIADEIGSLPRTAPEPEEDQGPPAAPAGSTAPVDGSGPEPLRSISGGVPGHPALPRRPRRRAASARWAAAGAVVAAAAAVIIVLAVSLGSVDARVGRLQSALAGHGVDAGVAAALANPAHLDATLRSPSGHAVGEAVVAGGHGYLVGARMAVLPASKTYQLWAVVNGRPVSVGVLGNRVTEAAFTMGTLSPDALAVTVEPARGSVAPTTAPVATAHM